MSSCDVNDEECCVCLKVPDPDKAFILPCSHVLCAEHATAVAQRMGRCPYCQQPFAAEDARPMINVFGQLDILCFDTSSSMWWSDGLIGLVGRSRLEIATDTAYESLRQSNHAPAAAAPGGPPQHWACVSTFDTDWRLVLPPREVSTKLGLGEVMLRLRKLKPDGTHTAFFDAYHLLLLYIQAVPRWRNLRLNVMIFTDGQDNLSSMKNSKEVTDALRSLARQLHVVTIYVNVGGNVSRSKHIADMIDARFFDVTSECWMQKAESLAAAAASRECVLPAKEKAAQYAKQDLPLSQLLREREQKQDEEEQRRLRELQQKLPSVPSEAPAAAALAAPSPQQRAPATSS